MPRLLNLSWNRPTTRNDGSPLAPADIAKYRVLSIDAGGVASIIKDDVTTLGTQISLEPGTYNLAVEAVDTNTTPGEDAILPGYVVPPAPPAPPSAPGGFTAVIVA